MIKWSMIGLAALLAFAGFIALILAMQGRLNVETLQSAVQQITPPAEESEPLTSNRVAPAFSLSLPSPFVFEEISDLVESLKRAKSRYEQKEKALEVEKESLQRIRQDVEERKKQIDMMMEKVNVVYAEFRQQQKDWEEQKLQFARNREESLKKLAKMFEGMNVDQASERLTKMDDETVAKILYLMRQRSASKLLSTLPPEKVKVVSDLMQQRIAE